MIRILLCCLFIISCSSNPVKSNEVTTSPSDNFIFINTMCGYPVKVIFKINGVIEAQDIDPEDKYALMNFKTFLTIFPQNQRFEAPLNKALLSVAKIRCD